MSAQLSVTGLLKLSVPIYKGYKFEGSNTMTGDTYLKDGPNIIELESLLLDINELIDEFRELKFGGSKVMYVVINRFIHIASCICIYMFCAASELILLQELLGHVFNNNKAIVGG